MIPITSTIGLDESEIETRFIHASGPGGQNVNKVATAVQIRFDVWRSHSVPEAVKARLVVAAGQRISKSGVITITAQRTRSQARNRDDAIARLAELIRSAARPPKVRRPTRPTRASRERRLTDKRQRGDRKRTRGGAARAALHDE